LLSSRVIAALPHRRGTSHRLAPSVAQEVKNNIQASFWNMVKPSLISVQGSVSAYQKKDGWDFSRSPVDSR